MLCYPRFRTVGKHQCGRLSSFRLFSTCAAIIEETLRNRLAEISVLVPRIVRCIGTASASSNCFVFLAGEHPASELLVPLGPCEKPSRHVSAIGLGQRIAFGIKNFDYRARVFVVGRLQGH